MKKAAERDHEQCANEFPHGNAKPRKLSARRIEVESHSEIPEMRSHVLSQGNAPCTHASDCTFVRSAYRPVCSMRHFPHASIWPISLFGHRPLNPIGSFVPCVPKQRKPPYGGLPDVAQVIALENGAIHYSPVTSMKSVWASPRWKISFSSTA